MPGMSETDLCARCGGDCPMTRCPECGGCENTGPGRSYRRCPECDPEVSGDIDLGGDWEPCDHDHDDDCYDGAGNFACHHEHCFNCGGCRCPGYCDDYQTYNLRPAETGGGDER